MKVIIQCSGSKHPSPFVWDGRSIYFVSKPEYYVSDSERHFAHPDGMIPGDSQRWRDVVADQSENAVQKCLRAADLYKPKIYRELAAAVGYENCFILSAGWGLVRGDFRLPGYDITFSGQAEKGKRRSKRDPYRDFNDLSSPKHAGEDIAIFAGLSYLPLLDTLLGGHHGSRTAFYKSDNFVRRPGYDYRYFDTRRSTNWHYDAAKTFIANGCRV